MRHRIAAFLLALALPFLMGAEGCQDQRGDRRGVGPPPRVPDPNPDTGPGTPKTPNPGAADPGPGECHVYSLFATWAPGSEFVKIEWELGPDDGVEREKRGGEWDKTRTLCGDVSTFVKVQFTEISKRNLRQQGGGNPLLTATVLVDGHGLGPRYTSASRGADGFAAASYDP